MSGDSFRWGSGVVDIDGKDLPGLKARFMVEHCPFEGTIVEVGCGQGKMLRTLALHRPRLNLHGCDVRPIERPSDFSFSAVASDGPLPYADASADVVLMMDVLEHVPQPERTLEEAWRILRPRGGLVAFVPTEGQPFSAYRVYRRLLGQDLYVRTKDHVQAFSREDLLARVARRFDLVERRFAYHFLGHIMDASLFAAMTLRPVASVFWQENAYYRETTSPSPVSRVFNGALRFANRLAWLESTTLAEVSFGSAGVLLSATRRS